MKFKESGDKIDFNKPLIPQNNWTISFWVNPSDVITNHTIIGQFDSEQEGRFIIRIGHTDNQIDAFHEGFTIPKFSPISTDVWYHIIITHTGTALNLYINGNLEDSQAGTRNTYQGNDTRIRGIGDIDDVRIYNTALTAEEIERVYTETKHKYLADY